MVHALTDLALLQEAPAIVGCQAASVLAEAEAAAA